MKIYLISQDVNNGWDTFDSAIVIAENEEEGDGKYDKRYGGWSKKEFVEVEYIGEAKKGSERGVVCASFNAG